MQNTKLGISAGLIGAILFIAGLAQNLTILLIVAGYVLLVEDNVWLRRAAVKAAVISIAFSALYYIIHLIPDFFAVINDLMEIFDETLSGDFFEFIGNLVDFLDSTVSFARVILFLLLALKALGNATIIIAPVDNFINKHIN